MMDDMHEVEKEANTSTNAPRRLSVDRQALGNPILELDNAYVSNLKIGDTPTIYKVPKTIRQVNKVAYVPKIVSIGPYHHGPKKSLKGMEDNKRLYIRSFLSRNPSHQLKDYLEAIEKLKDEARSCYSEEMGPQMGNEFVKMMVHDVCFIAEIFLRFYPIEHKLELLRQKWKEPEQNKGDLGLLSAIQNFFFHPNGFQDPIIYTSGISHLIGYDMLLLENQIPFFLLEHIFKMACPVDVLHLFAKMALHFFDQFMPTNKKIKTKDSYHHLLHLLHSHLLPTPNDSEEEPNRLCNRTIKYVLNKLKNLPTIFPPCSNEAQLPITEPREMIPCAADLELAGVKFKKNEESNGILNLKFSDGVLEIPFLVIRDSSESLFRNLVAFEQCYPGADIYFTTYLMFMDFLVNTSKDVALLHNNGIIDNLLGSDDDVTHIFNRLCTGIFRTFEGSYLWDLKENVQKHYENKWNRWEASLRRDYFTNPWSVISLIAASILLLLAFIQTFFTIFPYHGPRF